MRLKQIRYQMYYRMKNLIGKKSYNLRSPITAVLRWESPVYSKTCWQDNNTFTFLNLQKTFETINWNYNEFGKLWTYNLTYFDFLNQRPMSKEIGLQLILDFLNKENTLEDALEAYPISLRGINWIKFLSTHNLVDVVINSSLYNQYQRLYDNLEYHLMGNHLLENGFSLLFAASYFKDEKFHKRAYKILKVELDEQILEDGAHFELSPMYHQIILHRILDCINLLQNNNPFWQDGLLDFLRVKAIIMLSWLDTVTYKNGSIPMVNDATYGIAPTSNELFNYAKDLNLNWDKIELSASGYRKMVLNDFEMFIDVGAIGPSYIPGHAHADTFSFELSLDQKQFIVDTGISTYEKNTIRQVQRSTESHNTVKVNEVNQTEVWGGFRVARRAKIIDLIETECSITASHNGYERVGIIHQRSFKLMENKIIIEDNLIGKLLNSVAYFHLHPSLIDIVSDKNNIYFPNLAVKIIFVGNDLKLETSQYDYALGFNKTEKGTVIKVTFEKKLTTTIIIDKY